MVQEKKLLSASDTAALLINTARDANIQVLECSNQNLRNETGRSVIRKGFMEDVSNELKARGCTTSVTTERIVFQINPDLEYGTFDEAKTISDDYE